MPPSREGDGRGQRLAPRLACGPGGPGLPEVFGQGDDFVQKITGSPSVDRPLQKIREFRNRPDPKVVVTVDMLSTGVDIPSLEFVVFMRR